MMLNKIKEEGIELQTNMQNIPISTRDIEASRPNNCRIPLSNENNDNENISDESEEEEDMFDDLGRDEVKKASESIIRESKLKAKRRLKGRRRDDDD